MHAEYLHAINPEKRQRAVNFVLDLIKGKKLQFDTIAVRGFSATSIGSMVAYLLEKPLCYIRKEEESCNSCNRVEYDQSIGKFLIIDDLVCSGNTVKQIIEQALKKDYKAECIGVALYRDRMFFSPEDLEKGYRILCKSSPSIPKVSEIIPVAIDMETTPLNSSKYGDLMVISSGVYDKTNYQKLAAEMQSFYEVSGKKQSP